MYVKVIFYTTRICFVPVPNLVSAAMIKRDAWSLT